MPFRRSPKLSYGPTGDAANLNAAVPTKFRRESTMPVNVNKPNVGKPKGLSSISLSRKLPTLRLPRIIPKSTVIRPLPPGVTRKK
jgi:hypothetical protein